MSETQERYILEGEGEAEFCQCGGEWLYTFGTGKIGYRRCSKCNVSELLDSVSGPVTDVYAELGISDEDLLEIPQSVWAKFQAEYQAKDALIAEQAERIEKLEKAIALSPNVAKMNATISSLRKLLEEVVEAIEPFETFGGNVDESGWKSNIHREAISNWFGPYDFRSAKSISEKIKGVMQPFENADNQSSAQALPSGQTSSEKDA